MADEVKDKEERVNPFQTEVDAENAKRSGVGLRWFCGFTRGKGSIPIKWEAFDADSEPKDMQEFVNITKAKGIEAILPWAIIGYNDMRYTEASDPIAEHVNKLWDETTQMQFRLVVRNLSKATGQSFEDVVAMVKPGVEKAFASKQK